MNEHRTDGVLKPQQWQTLVKQLQSNMHTQRCKHKHTYIYSSPDTQNAHLTLKRWQLTAKTCFSDRSNLIYNACVKPVCVWKKRRAEGVRGQNCKFESVAYLPSNPHCTLSPPSWHVHKRKHTYTVTFPSNLWMNIDLHFLTIILT